MACKDCKKFDTACVATSAQTDYCRKTGETIKDRNAVRNCFCGGRKSYEELLQEAIDYFHKKASSPVGAREDIG